ncbi:MAG: hypothetical protein FGM14_14095 [Flavobacteriales bacterium]|nr:hypothetical protein [Flavobacteriales bacterium]
MANYTSANLVKAQIALRGAFANQDMRFVNPAVHKLFFSNSENFFPNYTELRTSEKRTIEAPFFVKSQRNLTTGRTHNHTGNGGDSSVLTPTWLSRSDDFSMTLKQQDSSVLQGQFEHELFNSVRNHMIGLEALASDTLLNNRTGVNVATNQGTFDSTNDVFEINATNYGTKAAFIAKLVMEINGYSNDLVFVCDPISYTDFMFLAANGATNATNTSFQFMGIEFIKDLSLTAKALTIDAAYSKGFWEVVPRNTIGGLAWIPKQNRDGRTTSVNTYGAITNPFDGLQYGIHNYETRADGTSVNGEKQDVLTEFQLSIDVAYEIAPLSTATESPVFAFALV